MIQKEKNFFGCWFTNIPLNNDVAVHWKKSNPFTQGHLMQILIENVTMIMEILNFIVTTCSFERKSSLESLFQTDTKFKRNYVVEYLGCTMLILTTKDNSL